MDPQNDMFNASILPIVRHGMQILTGILLAQGQLDVTNAETLSGAVLGLFTVGWWWFSKRRAAK